jgi:cell division inhibitor SepF
LINLEGADVDAAQRIIDFVSGACYSIDGKIKMVSTYIFMASPSSIELSGDFGDRANISDGNNY